MRKALVAVIALAMLGALGTPAEAAPKRFKVSIVVSSSVVYSGQAVTISGRVRPAAVGRKVVIQKKLSTSSSWENEGRARIRANGTFTFTDRPTSMKWRRYRVVKPKQGKRKAGYSKTRKVTIRKPVQRPASLTITGTGSTTLDAGQQFILRGTASANLRGQRVQLQLKDGSSWSRLAGSRVGADGRFVLKGNATRSGRGQQVRAFAQATAGSRATASQARSFTVYGWYYLADRDLIDDDDWQGAWDEDAHAQNIDGVTYAKTTAQLFRADSGWGEWDLQRRCTRLIAAVGLLDSSATGSRQHASVGADSVILWSRTNIALGQSFPVNVDLSSALRLRLTATAGSGSGRVGFGDARIRCAF